MKQGWFLDPHRNTVVWATGNQYTRDGTAPGRVETIVFMTHLGPFVSWCWDGDLKEAPDRGIAAFVDGVKVYYERQRADLREQIADCDRAERRWISRCSAQTVSPK